MLESSQEALLKVFFDHFLLSKYLKELLTCFASFSPAKNDVVVG
jgi:hypothetical protein